MTAINRLSTIWKTVPSDKIKWKFFKAVAMSELPHGCTTWTLTKHLVKKLEEKYTKIMNVVCLEQILEAAPHKTAVVQPYTSHQANHSRKASKICWVLKGNKLITNVLLWTPTHGHTRNGWPAKTCIYQTEVIKISDTGCHLENLQSVMVDRDKWPKWFRRV